MDERPIVVVSNRGPVSFRRTATDDLEARRGAGGLVSGLSPLMHGSGRVWIAAALSEDDRAAVAMDPTTGNSTVPHRSVEVDGIHAVLVGIDAHDLDASYETVCNETLWYVHHHLFATAREPVFDPEWFKAWAAYRRVNATFAELITQIAPPNARVLVQDYHLYLVGPLLARRRPDLTLAHFSHTPFADPSSFAILPDEARVEILKGLSAYRACGFHTSGWRDAFLGCCTADGIDPPETFIAPLGPDVTDLDATRKSVAFAKATDALSVVIGDRMCIARSDRIELSKNLIRGFQAFDLLLETHPEWRERVVFAASVYPSRESNPDYVDYRRQTEACVEAINARWSTGSWTPIHLDTSDDFPTSVATLARADVVLVNPIRDGLNLVACEAMLVNKREALLALSPRAGVFSLLGDAAQAVHPYDIVQTARVLDDLLRRPSSERAATATRLRTLAAARTPTDWLNDQLDALA